MHCDSSIGEQIFQLQGLAQVCVPHHAAVLNAYVLKGRYTVINVLAAVLQGLLGSEDCCIILRHKQDLKPAASFCKCMNDASKMWPDTVINVLAAVLESPGFWTLLHHSAMQTACLNDTSVLGELHAAVLNAHILKQCDTVINVLAAVL